MDIESIQKLPVNLGLLVVQPQETKQIFQITDMQIFDNLGNFHPNGLFSTVGFGQLGSEHRNRKFGYIDLKVPLMHPLVYHAVINLKSYYKQILEGKLSAVFNEKTGSFDRTTGSESETGYAFFMKHIEKIKFEKNDSQKRDFLIQLFEKTIKEKTYRMQYLLVLPAGIRDYVVDASGKPQEDEVNAMYRKLIYNGNLIDEHAFKKVPQLYDNISYGMQNALLELFDYIKSLLEGKHKLVLGKWLTRKIFNSTRNVSSNPIEKVKGIDDPNRIKSNECFCGLHQYLRTTSPKSYYEIKTRYVNKVFAENSQVASVINKKTLKKEEVANTSIQKDYDNWTSADGIEKMIANFGNLDIRHLPITVNHGKHYFGLVYNDGKVVRFLQDIDEVPDGFDKSKVSPITYAELFYMSIAHLSGKLPGLVTRYPITGYGSIYPVLVKVQTTTESSEVVMLDDTWNLTETKLHCFPKRGFEFHNTLSVHYSHYDALTLDTDGDTLSLMQILSDEGIEEINEKFSQKSYYVSDKGTMYFSSDTAVLNSVLSFITG